jgi:L-ascorbate metabolism protein UlaG (beta-lactamase superfamily)
MKKILLKFLLILVTLPVFSQNVPQSDKLKTASGDIELFFIGHGSLMFRMNGLVIHVDPVKAMGDYSALPKADIILVTHEHGDHLDTALIAKLRKPETVMLCNARSAAKVKWAEVMKPGDTKKIGTVTVEAVFAYNILHKRPDGVPFHSKGEGNGYVVTLGGKKIYVAGDTENIPEMKDLKNIDVAFLPVNLPYTMTPEMAADAVKSFRPAVFYPYHFGETKTDDIVSLLKDSGIEVRIRNLK